MKISSFLAKTHLVFHWCLYNKKGYTTLHRQHNNSNSTGFPGCIAQSGREGYHLEWKTSLCKLVIPCLCFSFPTTIIKNKRRFGILFIELRYKNKAYDRCIWNISYKNCRNEIKWRMILAVVNAIYAIAFTTARIILHSNKAYNIQYVHLPHYESLQTSILVLFIDWIDWTHITTHFTPDGWHRFEVVDPRMLRVWVERVGWVTRLYHFLSGSLALLSPVVIPWRLTLFLQDFSALAGLQLGFHDFVVVVVFPSSCTYLTVRPLLHRLLVKSRILRENLRSSLS